MARLDGKVAFITGAGSGIGFATALRFAREGAIVVGLDLAECADWKQVADAAPAAGFHVADVRDAAAQNAAVAAAREQHGGIDVLVTAAGIAGGGPVHLISGRRLAARAGREPDRDVPVGEGGAAVDDRAAQRQHRHDRERRGHRGLRGRQHLQRLEGRRRPAHQEHGDRLRPDRHPRQLHLPGLHRHAAVPQYRSAARFPSRTASGSASSTSSAASAAPRRSRARRCSSPPTTPRSSPASRCRSTAASPRATRSASRS